MIQSPTGKWNQSANAAGTQFAQIESMFRLLFENSIDAILILDPGEQRVLECNTAAVQMSHGGTRDWLLSQSLLDLSADVQSDGRSSREKIEELIAAVLLQGTQKFDWLVRRFNGDVFPVEVVLTPAEYQGKNLFFAFARDISERKKEETRMLRLNEDLEARVGERTQELIAANEKLKAEVRERRRKEKVQRALFQISEAIHTSFDVESLFERIHRTVGELMDARNFYIALHNPETGNVEFPYFIDERDTRPEPATLSTGLTSFVLRTGKPLLVNRRTGIQRTPDGVSVLREGPGEYFYHATGSPSAVWLGAPLSVRGNTFGVIAVQHYENENAFGDDDKQILTFVAEQVALAIDRKQGEEELCRAHCELTAMLEALPGFAFYKDLNGAYRIVNENFAIAAGCDKEAIVGRTDLELFPLEYGEKFRADDLKLIASGEPLYIGEEGMLYQGRHIVVETHKVAVKDEQGKVIGVIGVAFDVTRRKQVEEELVKSLAREKELSQMKTNFVSTVSHEFRTPLGIIMSSSQILSDYFEDLNRFERKEHLDSITRNTKLMATLMEEVLLLSRVDSGKIACTPTSLDLRAFAARMIEEVHASTDRRCPIELQVQDSLEENLDEKLVRHILTNLLLNAVKYSGEGSVVLLRIERAAANILFTIRDSGIGIPEADQEWLFNAFHRGRNVGERHGTGLGLTIVKRCVELHHGTIQIESQLGRGTTVIVRLPVGGTR
jgi:PAS domain S-box-containing protein